ncbi:MAG TPA: DUF819 family protein, partial [Balneolales bacterium]|nr:DUF819 family protein [Balneolales bacterium]
MSSTHPLITNDAVVFGLLIVILAVIFKTSHSEHPFWKKFYSIIPSLLLCYFIPSLFNTFGIISGEQSHLYYVASRYLLPASLVLLTVSVDLPGIMRLGPKAIIMFLTGSLGVIIGGPIALIVMSHLDPSAMAGTGSNA